MATVITQIKNRRGTEAQWVAQNPTLGAGEIGVALDKGKFKMGDGVSSWNTLSYFQTGGGVGAAGESILLYTTVWSLSTQTVTILELETGYEAVISEILLRSGSNLTSALSGKQLTLHDTIANTAANKEIIEFDDLLGEGDTATLNAANKTAWIKLTGNLQKVIQDDLTATISATASGLLTVYVFGKKIEIS